MTPRRKSPSSRRHCAARVVRRSYKMISRRSSREYHGLRAKRDNPKVGALLPDRREARTLEIGFQLLRRRRFANLRGPIARRHGAMGFEKRPSRIGRQINVVDQHPAARLEDAKAFFDVTVAFPF